MVPVLRYIMLNELLLSRTTIFDAGECAAVIFAPNAAATPTYDVF